MGIVRAAALYFVLVFAAGWILGPIRVFVLAPELGHTAAVLIEAPLMLAAMALAARFVLRRLAVRAVGAALCIGLLALALLIGAEAIGVRWLRGLSLADYVRSLAPVDRAVMIASFALFAAMPALLLRR
jgi:hypothetical protein